MNILRLFGIGSESILTKNRSVKGKVTKVYRCWWLRIKTRPARLYASEQNTAYPYIITFEYKIDAVSYIGKLYIPIRCRVPQMGETIDVYYDPENPKKYACYAFGPGITSINW